MTYTTNINSIIEKTSNLKRDRKWLYPLYNKVHLSSINILIYYVFYVLQTRGFIFRQTVVRTDMVQCVVCSYMHQYKQFCTYKTCLTDVCKARYTIPVGITVWLKMNPRVWNT
jgi:hypothetical protein